MELQPLNPNDHNHVIELVPDGGYFVLNSLTIHYFVNPTPDNKCDTIYIHDTLYIEKIIKGKRTSQKNSIPFVKDVGELSRWHEAVT